MTEDDADIASIVENIGPKDGEPSGDGAITEYVSDAAYIGDDMFVAAGGASASVPPPPDGESAVSVDDLARTEILGQIKKRHSLDFQDRQDIPIPVLTAMRSLLLDGVTVANEDLVKQTLLIVLPAMDPQKLKRDERMNNERTSVLFRILKRELRKRGEKELVEQLEKPAASTPPPFPSKR